MQDKSCPTVVVTVDERQKFKSGALIAIDEIDEAGRIVRTSTVREKFVELRSADAIFEDISTPSLSTTINDKHISYCDKLTSDSNKSLKMATEWENSLTHCQYKVKKRKTHSKILSDSDISRNIISLRSER